MMISRTSTAIVALLLLASLAFAGCDGIKVTNPTQSPAPSASGPATAPPDTAAPAETPAGASDALSASPASTADATATPALPETDSPAPSPTDTPAEPTPTPTEAPTPTPVPTPHPGDRPDVAVDEYYGSSLPEGLTYGIKYTTAHNEDLAGVPEGSPEPLDYFVVLKSSAVRELPDPKAKSLLKVKLAQRLPLLAKVKGTDGKVWYRVDTGKNGIGYIPEASGNPRFFQLDKAFAKVKALKAIADLPNTVRTNNRKNYLGKPPLQPGSKSTDKYGNGRDQASPGYLAPDKTSSFLYIPDGSLGQLLGTMGDFDEVYFPGYDEVRYVPKKFISNNNNVIDTLTQAVVVDRKNQNIVTFEYRDGQWYIASMCFVSTGKKSGYAAPTPCGDFFTEKRPLGKYNLGEFWYMADGAEVPTDGTKPIYEGYAPYAIRFTGGAYLHGLPVGVSYAEGSDTPTMPSRRTYEFSTCLGTTPQSHMCVRNYTSHAKFMYDWVNTAGASVIVID